MAGSGGPGRTGAQAHEQQLADWRFDEPALVSALAHYRAAPVTRRAEAAAVEAELAVRASREPLAPAVARLGCYRGIAECAAAAALCRWQPVFCRHGRFWRGRRRPPARTSHRLGATSHWLGALATGCAALNRSNPGKKSA